MTDVDTNTKSCDKRHILPHEFNDAGNVHFTSYLQYARQYNLLGISNEKKITGF